MNRFASSGVEGAKLKCPKPAPWIWTTGSPSPVISYQSSTPLTSTLPSMRPSWVRGGPSIARCLTFGEDRADERALSRATDLARGGGGDRARGRRRPDPDRDDRAARAAHAARHRLLHRPFALRAG